MVRATGWSQTWVIAALSLGLLTSGLVSPAVGRRIERFGGRPVLAASAVLLAIGLLIQAAAPNVTVFIAAWLVIGVGIGAGLYDPAFSTLGRLYGEHARSAITHLTLFGGFASTVCWPLSAVFVEHLGWRGACLAYAAINVCVVLPLYLFGVPREEQRLPPVQSADAPAVPTRWQRAGDRRVTQVTLRRCRTVHAPTHRGGAMTSCGDDGSCQIGQGRSRAAGSTQAPQQQRSGYRRQSRWRPARSFLSARRRR